MSTDPRPTRVLLAKPTHDVHDRGVRLVARKMREAGFEVIFTNFLFTDEVVNAAVEEDVDVVGISVSSGGHLAIFEDLFAGLTEAGRGDALVIAGGVIPPDDEETIRGLGVAAVFGPGSRGEDAIEMVRSALAGRV